MAVTTIADFKAYAQATWGSERRNRQQLLDTKLPRIQDGVEFCSAAVELRIYLADVILRESTPYCGGFVDSSDTSWYVRNLAYDLAAIEPLFDDRRIDAMRAALLLLANKRSKLLVPPDRSNDDHDLELVFGMGGSALAAQYLLSQLEYLIRRHTDYLNPDGMVLKEIPEGWLRPPKGKTTSDKVGPGARINQIDDALRIYMHSQPDALSVMLKALDHDIQIAERLYLIRNPVMHGSMSDASVEGYFYALLLAMFFYSHQLNCSVDPRGDCK